MNALVDTEKPVPACAPRRVRPWATRSPFVGGLRISAHEMIGRSVSNNHAQWFAGADVQYTHTARTAIQRALSLLNLQAGDEVLVPAYHCGSELDVILEAGAQVRLFRTSGSGEIVFEDLQKRITSRTRAVYVIHYFGFPQPLAHLAEFCREKGLCLIEDCALSSLTQVDGRRIGSAGDMAIYNFPKVLPVPDGGALVINSPELQGQNWSRQRPATKNVLEGVSKLFRQSVLHGLPGIASRLLVRTVRTRSTRENSSCNGPVEIPESYYFNSTLRDGAISRLSVRIMERIDFSEVRSRRRANYSILSKRLSQVPGFEMLIKELPEGVCPLLLPLIGRKAGQVAQRLQARSIPALAWWTGYHRAALNWEEFQEARYLKDNVLAIPVHHQLSAEAVEFIGESVIECATAP